MHHTHTQCPALKPLWDFLQTPFTPSEVQHQIRRTKKSAPGADRLTYAHWKWADPEGAILSAIFNICRDAGRIPDDWKHSAVTLLPKGGDGNVIRNWRPICLQKTILSICIRVYTCTHIRVYVYRGAQITYPTLSL